VNTGRARTNAWLFVALGVGLSAALAGIAWPDTGWAIVHQVAQTAGPLGFCLATLHRAWRERTWVWNAVAVFGVGLGSAQIGWTAMGQISGPTSLDLTPDLIYAVTLPVGVAALVWLAFAGAPATQRWRILSDSLVVALGSSLFVWLTVFEPYVSSGEFRSSQLGALVYPFLDLTAGAIVIVAAVYQPHRPLLRWLAATVLVAATSDSVSALSAGLDWAGSHPLLQVMWMVAPILLTGAVLQPDNSGAEFPLDTPRRHLITLFFGVGVLGVVLTRLMGSPLQGVGLWLGIGLGAAVFINQFSIHQELRQTIAERTDALDALRRSESAFRLAFEGTPLGTLLVADGRIVDVNPALCSILGMDRARLVGRVARDLLTGDALSEIDGLEWISRTQGLEAIEVEMPWVRPNGEEVWLRLTASRTAETVGRRTICVVEDITERRSTTERLAHLAVHDPLTGLPNRAAFTAALAEALARNTGSVAVAFLDLDRFKVINDSIGHGRGDEMLTEIAERIRQALGGDGTAARFAGDEFTLLFVDLDRARVVDRILAVQHAISQCLVLGDGTVIYPTASVGVAWSSVGAPPEELLSRADAAMYRAKERGRNRVEFFDNGMSETATSQLRLVGEMHRALERGELRVYYQPIVEVASGVITGYEALVRWEHPERGLLAPGDFVDVAEEAGLIGEIGEWVLLEALGQLARWRERSPKRDLTMSINLAARQVNETLPAVLDAALAATGVPPDAVWLELTESALMADARAAASVLDTVRSMGIHVSVDDFGTGYSSMTYLQRFPVEGIKVDRSFVAGLGGEPQDEAICQAVISLGTALGLRVVAEGVETRLQLDRLIEMGCSGAQGYLFGTPQPAEQIEMNRLVPETAPSAPPTPAPAR
jgi:diguanylate cyclase (GGDEF)-like protein/PAS domain S-box-containing protein